MTKSVDLRNSILNYYKKNIISFRKIAKIFSVSHMTIFNWIKGLIPTNIRKSNIFHLEQIIINFLDKFPQKRLIDIQKFLFIKNIKVSKSLIHLIIKKIGYSYKKISFQKYRHNIEILNVQRQNFINNITSTIFKSFIVIDETYFYTSMQPHYGYNQIGKKLFIPYKLPQFKYSLIQGITYTGKKYIHISKSNITTDIFYNFIKILPSNSNLLLDNVSFHKSKKVIDLMNNKNIKPFYTPPYSPEFSPIEFNFSKIKSIYKRLKLFSKIKDDFKLIKKSIKLVSTNEIQNMFNSIINKYLKA